MELMLATVCLIVISGQRSLVQHQPAPATGTHVVTLVLIVTDVIVNGIILIGSNDQAWRRRRVDLAAGVIDDQGLGSIGDQGLALFVCGSDLFHFVIG